METIQGVRTKLIIVSYAHGAIRVPLAQSFNYTPRITERTINEFDNLEAAQIVTTFDGVDVTFDYLDSDSKLVDSMFADTDPEDDMIVDDPTNYKKVQVFANMKGLESGKIFASVLAKMCRAKGSPYTEPVKEEARVTRDCSGTNVLKIKGAALQYERILANAPSGVFEQGAANAYADLNFPATTPFEITHVETALTYGGSFALWVVKNGVEVTSGFTATAAKFTVSSAPAASDVWEVYTMYLDA